MVACKVSGKLLTYTKNSYENAIDHQLSYRCSHIDLLIYIYWCHFPCTPHSPNEMSKGMPTSLLWLSIFLKQWEIIIAYLI